MTPAVRGDRDLQNPRVRFLLMAVTHSLGNVVAASAVALVLISLTAWFSKLDIDTRPLASVVTIGLSLLYLPRLMGLLDGPPLWQSHRQVPRAWYALYPGWRVALFWGLALGSGLYTRIIVPTYYLLLIWPFMGIGTEWTLAIWMTYAIARSGNFWWLAATTRSLDSQPTADFINDKIVNWTGQMLRANALVMSTAAITAAGGLF